MTGFPGVLDMEAAPTTCRRACLAKDPSQANPKWHEDRRASEAAGRPNELREAWLNPPDLVKRVPEVVPGYPDRVLPVDARAAAILKTRTLTTLYNERPTWLDNAHRD